MHDFIVWCIVLMTMIFRIPLKNQTKIDTNCNLVANKKNNFECKI